MTPTELAWLAGWLEGEASFYYILSHGNSPRIIVQVFSTDIDVLQKASALMGAKNIINIPPRECRGTQWQSKGGWRTEVQGEAAAELMRKLLPFMGVRRTEQITGALEKWEARPTKPVEKLCACGCGRTLFGGSRMIYARRNGVCAQRAYKARRKEARSMNSITPGAITLNLSAVR